MPESVVIKGKNLDIQHADDALLDTLAYIERTPPEEMQISTIIMNIISARLSLEAAMH